ncbi:hypothetical protein EYF80_014186 [Liparis tanakae]|uniref:Uncharacterized protein n=1 Tax=Liparis tanakae TaxID=230148 RepID=A0A4Z2ICA5_9TELE|nr:hypothetical protein EYF80_014186 [Liparis tanakae]
MKERRREAEAATIRTSVTTSDAGVHLSEARVSLLGEQDFCLVDVLPCLVDSAADAGHRHLREEHLVSVSGRVKPRSNTAAFAWTDELPLSFSQSVPAACCLNYAAPGIATEQKNTPGQQQLLTACHAQALVQLSALCDGSKPNKAPASTLSTSSGWTCSYRVLPNHSAWGWFSTGATESDTYITRPVSAATTNRKPSAASRIRCFSSYREQNKT